MRILVLGGSGMLGHKLVGVLKKRFDVWSTIRGRFSQVERFPLFEKARVFEGVDAVDLSSVRNAIESSRPEVVINAIGVIKQRPTANDVITTLNVNSIFPHQLAKLSREYAFRLISVSTDCVFSGERGEYTEQDTSDALDLYGRSKQFGEVVGDGCLTLRTSIIGRELDSSHSLIEWFIANKGGSAKGYTNAIYSGFPTMVFADIIGDLVLKHPELQGLYHVSSDPISKYDLLRLVNESYGLHINIEPYDDFKIDRSLDSSKFKAATGFVPSKWKTMVDLMAADPTPYKQWKTAKN